MNINIYIYICLHICTYFLIFMHIHLCIHISVDHCSANISICISHASSTPHRRITFLSALAQRTWLSRAAASWSPRSSGEASAWLMGFWGRFSRLGLGLEKPCPRLDLQAAFSSWCLLFTSALSANACNKWCHFGEQTVNHEFCHFGRSSPKVTDY